MNFKKFKLECFKWALQNKFLGKDDMIYWVFPPKLFISNLVPHGLQISNWIINFIFCTHEFISVAEFWMFCTIEFEFLCHLRSMQLASAGLFYTKIYSDETLKNGARQYKFQLLNNSWYQLFGFLMIYSYELLIIYTIR